MADEQKKSTEETTQFTPKWNDAGLVTVVAIDHSSRDVLMVAHMNEDALRETLTTGDVTYWSRSRQKLWRKGETSGHTQKLIEMHVDCDQDCLLAYVEQQGMACHTNRRTCFYRQLSVEDGGKLIFVENRHDVGES